MVQARTRIMHQLQAVTLIEGLRCKKRLWREKGRKQLEAFQLAPWASRRRRDLLELLDQLDPTIAELSQAIEQEVEKYPAAQRLMTHPGMGALTAPGLRADHRRGRAISVRQANGELSRTGAAGGFEWQSPTVGPYYQVGNSILRFLLVEAAQGAARSIPQWRSQYFHLTMRRGKKTAKVAMAQRLAARLYWMMRKKVGLPTSWEFPSHAEQPGNRHGVESNTE